MAVTKEKKICSIYARKEVGLKRIENSFLKLFTQEFINIRPASFGGPEHNRIKLISVIS
jgi:hypothetical protein